MDTNINPTTLKEYGFVECIAKNGQYFNKQDLLNIVHVWNMFWMPCIIYAGNIYLCEMIRFDNMEDIETYIQTKL